MHARHRSPGNGVRPNSMGMVGLTAARISPEGSIRAHGMYNSDYRNFNRGFGRGPPKPYPPLQPPRRGDILMEAGRLAAEYLVSQGLLPPNVLPGKWQNVSLKSQMGDFQEFRSQDRENIQLPSEGRTSALARLGNVVPDAGSGRRRFSDEFNSPGSRNHMRGRRRMGSFRGYGSDWGRENGRSGSWSEKARFSPDMEVQDDFVSGYNEEQQVGLDASGGVVKFDDTELPSKSDIAGDSESELENYEFPDEMGSKASSSSTRKGPPPESDGDYSKGSDESKILNLETGEVKDGMSSDEMEKQGAVEDFSMQHPSVKGDALSKSGNDLLRLCSFIKVPTKTRSSLAYKGTKVDPALTIDEGYTCDIAPLEGPKVLMEEDSVEDSSSDMLTNQTHSLICLESDISGTPSVQCLEDAGDLDPAITVERGKCMRSQSFPDRSFMYEQESVQDPPGFGRCISMVKERGEKRALQNEEMNEGSKKPREWPSSMVTDVDECFRLHNFREKTPTSHEERLSPDDEVVEVVDQERLVDVALFPKGGAESGIELIEEKQLFPSSFKICDLNLMETSDMTENHDSDPLLGLPSTLEAKKEISVDVDLSISNNCNRSDDFGRYSADVKEVVVLDVANDSLKEDKAFDTSERKSETIYSSMENFPNHTESTGDLPDVQDGYGLMISELLGTDISNCSTVPPDITGLHTEMGLHNGAGILADDDSIYLSLGEIPIRLGDEEDDWRWT